MKGFLFKYLVMPFLSKAVMWFVEWVQDKREEAKRKKEVDEAINEFKQAETPEEKEAAFKKMVRGVRRRTE